MKFEYTNYNYYKFQSSKWTIEVPMEPYSIWVYSKKDIEVRFKSKNIRFKKAVFSLRALQDYLENRSEICFHCIINSNIPQQTMDESQIIYQLERFMDEYGIDKLIVIGSAAKVLRGEKSKASKIKIRMDYSQTLLLENKGIPRFYSKKIKGTVQRIRDIEIYNPKHIEDGFKFKRYEDNDRIFVKI